MDIVKYHFDPAKHNVPVNAAIAKANSMMHDMEIDILGQMVNSGMLEPNHMLIVDGPLQFIRQDTGKPEFADILRNIFIYGHRSRFESDLYERMQSFGVWAVTWNCQKCKSFLCLLLALCVIAHFCLLHFRPIWSEVIIRPMKKRRKVFDRNYSQRQKL